ncbi:hypothetical protein LTR09_010318 [Extremus antarcticus]|uniref:VOC domain-containing protein n=1 Tax=Extremus antarcticus TaxID=702011 RepID=A0AAJ0DEJ0_9PEZI|nr:hypothetical protein LTR09_010318 [Extremus antarcticus]
MANLSDQLPPTLSQPFLGQPIEICIVTGDLRSTLTGLCKLGIGPFKIFHFTASTLTSQTLRGQPASFALDVAFAEQGSMIWEVMQPVSGQTVMQEFLDATGGKGGIHHVAFDCATCSGSSGSGSLVGEKARAEAVRRREEFEQRGFEMVMSGVWHGKKGTCEFMFFDTEGAINTCFETYVFSDDWEEPEDVEVFPPEQRTAH